MDMETEVLKSWPKCGSSIEVMLKSLGRLRFRLRSGMYASRICVVAAATTVFCEAVSAKPPKRKFCHKTGSEKQGCKAVLVFDVAERIDDEVSEVREKCVSKGVMDQREKTMGENCEPMTIQLNATAWRR